ATCLLQCLHVIVALQHASATRTPRSAAKASVEDSNVSPKIVQSSADSLTIPRRTPSFVRNPYPLMLEAEDPRSVEANAWSCGNSTWLIASHGASKLRLRTARRP